MKKTLLSTLALIFALTLVLAACSGGGGGSQSGNNPTTQPTDAASNDTGADPAPTEEQAKELSGKLTLWSFSTDMFIETEAAFEELYPNVDIEVIAMDFNEMHDGLLTAIAAGTGGPDVVFLEGGQFHRFNAIEGLEDLLSPPYNAGQYIDDFTEANWNRWLSIDGKRLIGMPWDMPPAVTFYRQDIMEENGFPTDPSELMAYMANPDNFMNMARTLKNKDIYLMEWRDQPMGIMNNGISFFDKDLNYRRNSESFVQGLDISKQVAQEELFLGQTIWGEEGQQAIKNGKLAFVFLGSWGASQVTDWGGPEQEGKWRVTGLPFGAFGGQGGSVLSILSQSQNKELAWEFVKWTLAGEAGQKIWIEKNIMPGWKPAWDLPEFKNVQHPYLGNQNVNQLYAVLLDKVPPAYATPLDGIADEIWGAAIGDVLDKNLDSRAALQQIEDDIMAAVSIERQKLLEAR